MSSSRYITSDCDPMDGSTPAFLSSTISWSLLKFMSIESVTPSNHRILCRPLLLLPSIFSTESALCIRWLNDWSFSFSFNPSSEYSRLISLRINWFDLLAIQWTLKSLLQHYSSKASILGAQPFLQSSSHIYMWLLERPHLWLYWPLSAKWCLCFFNTLSSFVLAILPRNKHLLILWLQSPSAVILEPKKVKSDIVSTFSPIYLPWSDRTGCHDCFMNVEF